MKSYDLIIKNAQIHTMDEDRKVYAKGIIGIEGEKITLIKEMNELTPEELQECEGAGRVIDRCRGQGGISGIYRYTYTYIPVFPERSWS